MNRRTVLLGLAATLGSAGCIGNSPGDPSPTPTPTTSPTPTTTQPPTPTQVDFSVTNRSCGSGTNAASVTFGTDAVTVDGTIGGRDTCDTAILDGVEWRDDTLTVRVKVVQEPATETVACGQCLTDIDYSVTVSAGDRSPATVKVVHRTADGTQTVTTAQP